MYQTLQYIIVPPTTTGKIFRLSSPLLLLFVYVSRRAWDNLFWIINRRSSSTYSSSLLLLLYTSSLVLLLALLLLLEEVGGVVLVNCWMTCKVYSAALYLDYASTKSIKWWVVKLRSSEVGLLALICTSLYAYAESADTTCPTTLSLFNNWLARIEEHNDAATYQHEPEYINIHKDLYTLS